MKGETILPQRRQQNITHCFDGPRKRGSYIGIVDLVRAERRSAHMSLVRQGKSPTSDAVEERLLEMYPFPSLDSSENMFRALKKTRRTS